MNKNFWRLFALILVIVVGPAFDLKSTDTVSDSEKEKTIAAIAEIIKENYVFPDVAEEISGLLLSKLENGDYRLKMDYGEFSAALTNDVQSFNGDKHLRVLFEPERIKRNELSLGESEKNKRQQERLEKMRIDNYGFKQIKILDGNIGYLELTDFADPSAAGETVASAVRLLENSYAIIIDLRKNGGGPASMVQLLASYFLPPEPLHLNSFYKRKENFTKQFWSLPYLPGNRLPDTPLYLLTSSRTFSAAEGFCYDMQQLERATVVGETTPGGAHPGGRIKATDKYNVWTPTARAINPISNGNWEGVGIKPDVAASAEDAFDVAYQLALGASGTQVE